MNRSGIALRVQRRLVVSFLPWLVLDEPVTAHAVQFALFVGGSGVVAKGATGLGNGP